RSARSCHGPPYEDRTADGLREGGSRRRRRLHHPVHAVRVLVEPHDAAYGQVVVDDGSVGVGDPLRLRAAVLGRRGLADEHGIDPSLSTSGHHTHRTLVACSATNRSCTWRHMVTNCPAWLPLASSLYGLPAPFISQSKRRSSGCPHAAAARAHSRTKWS